MGLHNAALFLVNLMRLQRKNFNKGTCAQTLVWVQVMFSPDEEFFYCDGWSETEVNHIS